RLGLRRGRRRRGAEAARPVANEADDVGEGGVVAQLELVVALDPEGFADQGEDLGLLDGIDSEDGFAVEAELRPGGVRGRAPLGAPPPWGRGRLPGRGRSR